MSATPTSTTPAAAGAPRRIKGPSAMGDDRARLLRLTWALAVTDFKLRYFGSALGYLWQIMRPLLLFGVLYVVFSVLLNLKGSEPFYPVALLLGIVLFTFFTEVTAGCVQSLVNRENLVRKIDFPRLAVPLSITLTALFNLGLNLIPVVVFLLASGGSVRLTWLELPVLVLIIALFAFGLGMLLSVLFVRYRDVQPIWDILLQVTFYATPIFYTVQVVTDRTGKEWIGKLLLCNPLAAVIQQMRFALIDASYGRVSSVMGGVWLTLVPLAVVAVAVACGAAYFARRAPLVAEEL